MKDIKIGFGYDVHKFEKGRPLVIGGVSIPFHSGLAGHSDADVLLHAICDALLGALGLGDIGKHFPDDDAAYKNIDSMSLLAECRDLIRAGGYRIGNIDSVVIAQKPKLSPYIDDMRKGIAGALELKTNSVSIKATTSEGLGFEGREEGISAIATVLIVKGES